MRAAVKQRKNARFSRKSSIQLIHHHIDGVSSFELKVIGIFRMFFVLLFFIGFYAMALELGSRSS